MTQNNANNTAATAADEITKVIQTIANAVSQPGATAVTATAAEFFISVVLGIKNPLGRKEAERQGCRTTAEQILAVPCPAGVLIPSTAAEAVKLLKEHFLGMVPKNEFETSVVQHTLESLNLGAVSPRSAAFVAWAGKVWRDRLACAAAEAEAKEAADILPAGGKMTLQAVFNGCRTVHTSYGVNCVHSFTADDGKELEWWTDRPWGYDRATNPDAPKEGERVTLTCRFKKPSVFRGKVTYRVTHAKFKAV